MKRILSGFAVLMAFGLVSSAKAESEMKKDLEARMEVCGEIAELAVGLQSLSQMQGTSRMGDLRDTTSVVQDKADEVVKAVDDYKKVQSKELKSANENLKKATEKLPNNITITQAKQQLQPQVSSVHDASRNLKTQIDCGM